MSDSENQGAKVAPSREATDVLVAIGKASGNITPAADFISDLEATITTLKAQLEAARVGFDSILYWIDGIEGIDAGHEGHYRHARTNLYRIAKHHYDALSAPASDTGSEEGETP